MTKIFRAALSGTASLVVASTVAVAMTAPAQAFDATVTQSTNQVATVTYTKAEVDQAFADTSLIWNWCADVVAASPGFTWAASVDGRSGDDRCWAQTLVCLSRVAQSSVSTSLEVRFVNYAGPMGWSGWGDSCGAVI